MILGLSIDTFIAVHVVISLVAIAAGLVAMIGLARGQWLRGWQASFLATTTLTSVTGFLFPFSGITPAFAFGVISMIVLAAAVATWPRKRTNHTSNILYAIAGTLALYLNTFVLVVQSFQKIDVLQALAPTQSEPAFIIAQALLLVSALLVGTFAVRSARSFSPG